MFIVFICGDLAISPMLLQNHTSPGAIELSDVASDSWYREVTSPAMYSFFSQVETKILTSGCTGLSGRNFRNQQLKKKKTPLSLARR